MKYSDMTSIADMIEICAKECPEKLALIDAEGEMTYGEVDKKARKIAFFLSRQGISSGDRIAIKLENSIEFVICLFGILQLGAVAVPINPISTNEKTKYIINNSDAKVVFIEEKDVEEFVESNILVISRSVNKVFIPLNKMFTLSEVFNCFPGNYSNKNDNISLIMYTSGTTNTPKGVIEKAGSIIFVVKAINSVINNKETDRIYCGLPFSFDYGLYQIFLSFVSKATLIIAKDLKNPLSIPGELKRYKVTGFPLVPSILTMLLTTKLLERIELPDLRYISSTGDVLTSENIYKLRNIKPGVDIYSMYGLTECKRVSILSPNELIGRENSVGKPLPGTNVKLVDASGEELECGKVGELVVSGNHVMSGYWKDEEETKKRFRIDEKDNKTYLYTNDFFKMDKEGYLYYVGRNEMIFKCNGNRVSAPEVEQHMAALQGVEEVAAVGVPDKIVGQLITIILKCNNIDVIEAPYAHFYKYFQEDIKPIKIIVTQEDLPKTINGKIDRAGILKALKRFI